MKEKILPSGVIRRRSSVKPVEINSSSLFRMDILGISNGKINDLIEKQSGVKIPHGYTVKPDVSGECYECAFCKITGYGEDEEIDCSHPNPRNTGCIDNEMVFVVTNNEN